MFEQELSELKQAGLFRATATVVPDAGARVLVDGHSAILCCSNDYLGLAGHPALAESARDALHRYGVGAGGSRLVSGTSPLHKELERQIAVLKGTQDAVLFNSGYAANTGAIPALVREGDAVFSDSLNHASIIDGCRLSRAQVQIYRHGDPEHLSGLLRGSRTSGRRLIITDGVFSMDGDIAPLREIVEVAERHGAMLMVDDAHATGVLGTRGAGTAEHFGVEGRVPVQMGTLGKALGSFGAYVAGDRGLTDLLRNRSRSFLYSTALPPAVCAASIAALGVLEKEPWRRERLRENIRSLTRGLREADIGVADRETPIVPLIVGDAGKAVSASRGLLDRGVFATAIRPPTVPEGTARIRLTMTAVHTAEDISAVISALADLRRGGIL